MRELFNLHPSGEGRMGADALDESNNPFELKSTTKNSVTTARDVGPHTLEKWRKRYWICAKGRNTPVGFIIDEVYFLAPSMMEEYISSIEARFEPDLELLGMALKLLKEEDVEDAKLMRLNYLVRRGLTLNNPKIPWHYVQSHGMKITSNHAKRLRQLVRKYPL